MITYIAAWRACRLAAASVYTQSKVPVRSGAFVCTGGLPKPEVICRQNRRNMLGVIRWGRAQRKKLVHSPRFTDYHCVQYTPLCIYTVTPASDKLNFNILFFSLVSFPCLHAVSSNGSEHLDLEKKTDTEKVVLLYMSWGSCTRPMDHLIILLFVCWLVSFFLYLLVCCLVYLFIYLQ